MTESNAVLKIEQDELSFDPREEFEHDLTTMVCWHRRYNLGDKHTYEPDNFFFSLAWEHDLLEDLKGTEEYEKADWGENDLEDESRSRLEANGFTFKPLYLYDHSGITMNTSGFSCHWDSGQVGWIYAQDKVLEEAGIRIDAEKVIDNDVAEYDKYLTGDIWWYEYEDDSCGGFFGLDSLREHLKGELGLDEKTIKSAIEASM